MGNSSTDVDWLSVDTHCCADWLSVDTHCCADWLGVDTHCCADWLGVDTHCGADLTRRRHPLLGWRAPALLTSFVELCAGRHSSCRLMALSSPSGPCQLRGSPAASASMCGFLYSCASCRSASLYLLSRDVA